MSEKQILADKVALITGGKGDIGRAVVAKLAEEGAAVALLDTVNQASRAVEACAELQAQGGQATFFSADVRQAAEIEWAVAGAQQTLGRLDILVNCAGIIRGRPCEKPAKKSGIWCWT